MTAVFNELIKRVKTDNGPGYSLINLVNNNKIIVKESKLTEFWHEYCQLIYKGGQVGLGLAEIPGVPSPVQISGTIYYNKDFEGELMTDEFIHNIVSSYFTILTNKLHFDKTNKRHEKLKCIYLQSDDYIDTITDNGKTKDVVARDFRFQFPWLHVDPNYHKKSIIKEVITTLKGRNALGDLEVQPESGWEQILNINSITEPVPLYGSGKDPVLLFKSIYYYDRNESDTVGITEDLSEMFAVDQHSHVRNGYVDSEKILSEKDEIELALPFFLSLAFYGQ